MGEDDLVRFRDPEIGALAASTTARLPQLADQLAERIRKAIDAHGPDAVIPLDDLRTSCRNHPPGQTASINLDAPRGWYRRTSSPAAGRRLN
jgi:hypothetical protein